MFDILVEWYREVRSRVIVGRRASRWFEVHEGVRQGCVLSPLLFLVFINELIRGLKEVETGVEIEGVNLNCLFFADDIVLISNCRAGLGLLVDKAVEYGEEWRFRYNPGKCKVMVFGGRNECEVRIRGEVLEVVSKFKYLGVVFDRRMRWVEHKRAVLEKARRKAYLMFGFGVGKGLSVPACVKLWEVVVRPVLEYGAEVWGAGEWEEAERLQREVGRMILGVSSKTANEVVLGELGWWRLKARRDKIRMKYWKILSDRGAGDVCKRVARKGRWRESVEKEVEKVGLGGVIVEWCEYATWRKWVTEAVQAGEVRRWRGSGEEAKATNIRIVKAGACV